MTHEAQPIRFELTGVTQNSRLNGEVKFMPDPGNTEGAHSNAPGGINKPNHRQVGAEQGSSNMFANSDPSNPDTRSTLSIISELQGMPGDVRNAAQERLLTQSGAPMHKGPEAISSLKDALPAKGTSGMEARAGGAPTAGSVNEAIDAINPDAFSDPTLKLLVKSLKIQAESGEVESADIKDLQKQARERFAAGADEGEFKTLTGQLKDILDRSRQAEQATRKQEAIEVNTSNQHIIDNLNLNEVNEFLRKVAAGVGDPEDLKKEYTRIKRKIADIKMENPLNPDGTTVEPPLYSDDTISSFELARAALLGDLSERAGRIAQTPAELQEKARLTSRLVEAIKKQDYDEIEKVINQEEEMNPNDRLFAPVISAVVAEIKPEEGLDHMVEFLMEYGLERIISVGDIAPTEQYPPFNLYETDSIDRLTQIARRYDENRGKKAEGMFPYLVNLRTKRSAMHELFRGMKDERTYLSLVTQLLRKSGLAFVEKQIVGVADSQIMYEQTLKSILALKPQGWLGAEDFLKADVHVQRMLDEDRSDGELTKAAGTGRRRKLREWEVKRAFFMGRSLSGASQRRAVWGVMGDVPANADERYKSLESELSAARKLAPMKVLPERFFDQPAAQETLGLVYEEKRRDKDTDELQDTKYGYVGPKGQLRGLYGNSQEAFTALDFGINDPKSNSWRARLMFLKQKDFQTERIGSEKYTIGEYLDLMKLKYPPTKDEHGHDSYEAFNKAIRGVIKDQRLFLGILLRYPNLDKENKMAIWTNAAKNIPSQTAAFFPKELDEDAVLKSLGGVRKWEEIKDKVFKAERARVRNDAKALSDASVPVRDLSYFFEMAKIDGTDKEFVERLQSFGAGMSETLAGITFPFAAFFDDAPKTEWENINDEDYDRILINDQSNYQEGYGHVIGVISNPVMKSEALVEAFTQAIEKIQGPPGLEAAQGIMEPIVTGVLRMRSARHIALWAGAVMKGLRIPRSRLETHNLQAAIADDAQDQLNILTGLSQKEVISDDPKHKDNKGRTQFIRMLDTNKARRRDRWYGMVRVLIMLLGPSFVKSVFGNLDLKSLGFEG